MISKLIHLAVQPQYGSTSTLGMEGEQQAGMEAMEGMHTLLLHFHSLWQHNLRSTYPGCCISNYVWTCMIIVNINLDSNVSKKAKLSFHRIIGYSNHLASGRVANH